MKMSTYSSLSFARPPADLVGSAGVGAEALAYLEASIGLYEVGKNRLRRISVEELSAKLKAAGEAHRLLDDALDVGSTRGIRLLWSQVLQYISDAKGARKRLEGYRRMASAARKLMAHGALTGDVVQDAAGIMTCVVGERLLREQYAVVELMNERIATAPIPKEIAPAPRRRHRDV